MSSSAGFDDFIPTHAQSAFPGPTRLIDDDAWDTHKRNFAILKENKLPGFDQTFMPCWKTSIRRDYSMKRWSS